MKIFTLLLLIFVFSVFLILSGELVHGKEVRIISLNPSATEILYALNATKNLVAVTQFCPFEKLRQEKENIGTVLKPDIEKIISLRPDVVIATAEGNRKITIDNLQSVNINVVILDEIRSFKDIYNGVDMIGKILKKDDEAQKLIKAMKENIENVKKRIEGKKRLTVFLQLGRAPLVTINRDTIINEMIELAGGENIAKNAFIRYPKYNREEVIDRNPDAIIIVSMGKYSNAALKEWKKYKSLAAVQNRRLHVIDSNIICNMGPRLVEGLEKIARTLHPEEFEK